jgi:hypothetical protein
MVRRLILARLQGVSGGFLLNRSTLVASALLASCAFAAIADNSSAKKAIQANYDKISAAFRAADPTVLDAMLAPNAVFYTKEHRAIDREHIIREFGLSAKLMKDVSWNRKVSTIKVHDRQAVVTVSGVLHGSYNGRDGTAHVVDFYMLSTDTWVWVRSAHAWQFRRADTHQMHLKVDGKEPPPPSGRKSDSVKPSATPGKEGGDVKPA